MNTETCPENGSTHRLLIVDDEPLVLESLKRWLRKEGYQIDYFSDPVAALKQAGQVEYDLVLSDYKMPSLDGVMLLALIRQIQPQAKRLILSAFTDKDALVEAINHAKIDQFIVKPCDPHDLKFEIRRSLDTKSAASKSKAAQ